MVFLMLVVLLLGLIMDWTAHNPFSGGTTSDGTVLYTVLAEMAAPLMFFTMPLRKAQLPHFA